MGITINTAAYDQHVANGGSPRTAPGFVCLMTLETPFQIASRRVAARAAIRRALRVRADRHYQARKQGKRGVYSRLRHTWKRMDYPA